MGNCDFQNKWMKQPCGKPLMNDWGDGFCPVHGTRSYADRAWDAVDEGSTRTIGKWSEEETELLRKLLSQNLSVREIAFKLNRSPYSIYNKLSILEGIDGSEETRED